MFRPALSSVICLGLLAALGCEPAPTAPEAEATAPSFAMAAHASADVIEARFDGSNPAFPEPPAGNAVIDATMVRNANQVGVRMQATATVPNTATMWAVIFNDHAHCVQLAGEPVACGADDLGRPEVNASVVRAGGVVLGSSPLVMTGHVLEGDTSEALFGPGLLDAETAEIHFLFRIHGPPIPTMTDDQILTVGGGCSVNDCWDVGAAIFLGN